ncbi:MAG: class I SAM-dependent methyltransferase [Clostridia bacterium]|nr:class I SAM-dependent methyltransferase [Clostridia bacterium]
MADKHLVRIADWGVTEQTVIFADDFVLDRLPSNGDILDIGCGRGMFDAKAARYVRSVKGIDIVEEEINIARQLHRHIPNLTFFVADAENLTAVEGQFDAIFSRFCFHHLNMDKVALGIREKLKTGGRLITIDCLEDYWKLSGSFFILLDATKRLGVLKMLSLLPRLLFFFTPKRFQHVKSDIARIKAEGRYHFLDFKEFYLKYFPEAEIGMIGCAGYVDWIKQ